MKCGGHIKRIQQGFDAINTLVKIRNARKRGRRVGGEERGETIAEGARGGGVCGGVRDRRSRTDLHGHLKPGTDDELSVSTCGGEVGLHGRIQRANLGHSSGRICGGDQNHHLVLLRQADKVS